MSSSLSDAILDKVLDEGKAEAFDEALSLFSCMEVHLESLVAFDALYFPSHAFYKLSVRVDTVCVLIVCH